MRTTLKNDHVTVTADTHGAELQSLVSRDGISYLWCGDPNHWGYHAPTLFPIIGSLRNNSALSAAGPVQLPKHGMARTADWTLIEVDEASVCYRFESDDKTKALYPYDFELRLTYRLQGPSVTTTYMVKNTGVADMPFTIGGHPAFAIPMAEGDCFEDYAVTFAYPETADLPQVDMTQGLIIGSVRNRFLTNKKTFTLNHVLFRGDALLFDRLRSRSLQLYSMRSGRGVQMDFDGMDYLAVWSPVEDAPFVCLEPWTGTATQREEDDVFEHKQGMRILAPGEETEVAFKVTVF